MRIWRRIRKVMWATHTFIWGEVLRQRTSKRKYTCCMIHFIKSTYVAIVCWRHVEFARRPAKRSCVSVRRHRIPAAAYVYMVIYGIIILNVCINYCLYLNKLTHGLNNVCNSFSLVTLIYFQLTGIANK